MLVLSDLGLLVAGSGARSAEAVSERWSVAVNLACVIPNRRTCREKRRCMCCRAAEVLLIKQNAR